MNTGETPYDLSLCPSPGKHRLRTFLALLTLAALCGPLLLSQPPLQARGRTWIVAPSGRSGAAGTLEDPLDLRTALSANGPVRAGDQVLLRGGRYMGAYTSTLVGSPSAPIIVRNFEGERATIDGYGAPPIQNVLTVRGADTWFWGLEIMTSDPRRTFDYAADLDDTRPTGVNIFGTRIRIINCVIHDALTGVGWWLESRDSEVYGTLIYNNGVLDTRRGEGHGMYIQNYPNAGTKRVRDVISWGNYATGMKAYGESSWVAGVHFEGVISFNNGYASLYGREIDKMENLFIGSTDNPASNNLVRDAFLYHRPGVLASNATLGYQNPNNVDLRVENLWAMGGSVALSIRNWQTLTVRGLRALATTSYNTQSDQSLAQVRNVGSRSWDGSQYWDDTVQRFPFVAPPTVNQWGTMNLSWTDWQRAGLDPNGQYTVGRPTGVWTALRPNQYEPGRAHIAVYNWNNAPSVTVDLRGAGLADGQAFVIQDAQNFYGPAVATGTYRTSSPTVSIPMTGRTAAAPVGDPHFDYVHTGPTFGAFVVLPAASASAPPPPPPSPAPSAEICGDGIDNDQDGQIDEGCAPPSSEVCGDGIDNDGDGQIDEGCAAPTPAPSDDTTAPAVATPTVSGTSYGGSYCGPITFQTTATDDVGVAQVQFLWNDSPIGAADSSAPYSVSLNTKTTSALSSSGYVSARASDAAGNTATSRRQFVRINNRKCN